MRFSVVINAIYACFALATAGEESSSTNSEDEQRERLFQRFLNESGIIAATGSTNFNTQGFRLLFNRDIVHPSFGIYWDEVPAPDVTGSNAMISVQAYIATNGWNMYTGTLLFTYGFEVLRPISGLPWEAIRARTLPAITHKGILYVILPKWLLGHACNGIAYNPKTNSFAPTISGFKHLARHWYAWIQRDDDPTLPRIYEGQPGAEQSR